MTCMEIDIIGSPHTPNSTPIMDMAPVVIMPTAVADNIEAAAAAPIPEEQQPNNKRRRKKSIVWEHFTIQTVGEGCMRAVCNQCNKSFAYITGTKLAGTSHLKRHITLGICPVSRQKNQQAPSSSSSPIRPKRRYRTTTPGSGTLHFDQDRCNQEIAKMIILHEYPLNIVENPAFIGFIRTLQPQYNNNVVSVNAIQGECVAMYLREKQCLLNLVSGISGRVSLTLDLATSVLDIGYAFITAHFIDDDWKLQRWILNVVTLPFPDSDYAINHAVASCLDDWHLRGRLFSLTLDQSFSNESIMGNLRGLLSVKNQLLFNCQLLKGHCYARILSRLAQHALGAMGDVIRRVRESVKYVKTSETRDEKFSELRQQLQVPSTKYLIIDDETKWNTTYQMVAAACELKEVFACLDTTDPLFKMNPSMNDWKRVEILCKYLKIFYDAASILTAPTYPTTSAFYHESSKIQLELTNAAMSQDPFVSSLTKPLKQKFDQYWKDCFLVLAIAVVMDPRFKMKLVEFSFSRIFGEDSSMWIKKVDDEIHELFLEYLAPNLSASTTFMEAGDVAISQSEFLQDAPAQEVAQQEPHFQEVPKQESCFQEVPLQVVHPANVPYQEVHFKEATAQDVKPEKVIAEVHPEEEKQENHSQEVPVQDLQTHELSMQEIVTHEVPVQEVHTDEAPSQEMHTQKVPLQERDNQEVIPEETVPKQVSRQEMHTQELSAEEVHVQKVLAQDISLPKAETNNMHPPEAQIDEMHNQGVQIHETHQQEGQPQEMNHQELPEEIHPYKMQHQELPLISIGDEFSGFEVYIFEITGSQNLKSELDQYLEEALLPRVQEFDILSWWKLNKLKYPTLSRMAADILSIPMSTVSPDFVFDTGSKKIDSYRSSLQPMTLEALICAKDWLQYGSSASSMEISNAI